MGTTLPFFKFWVHEWLGNRNVRRMTPIQRGYLIQLMVEYWVNGLPTDIEELAWCAGARDVQDFQSNGGDAVMAQFQRDGDRLLHPGLDQNRAECEATSDANRERALKRWSKYRASSPNDRCQSSAQAMHQQSDGSEPELRRVRSGNARQKQKQTENTEDKTAKEYPASQPSSTGTHGSGITDSPKDDADGTDPRFRALVGLVRHHYKTINRMDCPWSAKDGRQAKTLLASLEPKDWTIQKLDRCVQFKLWSVDRSASEAPHRWLADLTKYFEAPLDRFGRPDLEKRAAWERKFQQSAPATADSGEVLPDLHAKGKLVPDPALIALLDATPDPWKVIREAIRPSINPHSFDTWIRPLRFGGVDGRKLVVTIPSKEFGHVGEKYATTIQGAIERLRFPFESIEFVAPENSEYGIPRVTKVT